MASDHAAAASNADILSQTSSGDWSPLAAAYNRVRHCTEQLCEPLATEDYIVQSMADASPVKWHLAHTSWFFETFVLVPRLSDYRPFHPQFGFLFNSYYDAVGARWPRDQRGLLSRPTVAEVYNYRAYVDEQMHRVLEPAHAKAFQEIAATILLGLNHEQQHQELILTDWKHALALNPLRLVYRDMPAKEGGPPKAEWVEFAQRLVEIGHQGAGFAFDNETPRHAVFLRAFRLGSRLVTNREYLDFMEDGGYERPDLWLSDGWATRQARSWVAPLYWEQVDGAWHTMTLSGFRRLGLAEPVCHVSFYEADAFARWARARLPTETEWEAAAGTLPLTGHYLESGRLHPSGMPAEDDRRSPVQMFGDVWQWTASPYVGYPGYQPVPGALGEYNGKFMCNQLVLRGASCATSRSHARKTYRNFFPPDARWQFMGIRLARDLE